MALVKIELEMSEEEWAEVANALDTKSLRVSNGEYGPEYIPGTDAAWAACLDSAHTKVTEALQKRGVPW